ncbi:hypothetical protein [Pilimelia terevasa]|nr:hypothetical protein [Pilimelia terevasa]
MLTLTNVSSAAEVSVRGGGANAGKKVESGNQVEFSDEQADAAGRKAAQLVQNSLGGLSNAEILQVIDAGIEAEGDAKKQAADAGADGNTQAVLAAQARARGSLELAARFRAARQAGGRG